MNRIVFLVFILFCFGLSQAQVGINNSSPDTNAVLDLKSTNKGLLIPRLSTDQREAMSSAGFSQGMMVYDTDLDILFIGYGNGADSNKQWFAINPWKTEYRTNNNASAANMTVMTVNPNDTAGKSGMHYGNVGIGVPVPNEKLHVAGKVKATGLEITGKAGIGVASPTEKLEIDGKTKTTDLYVTGKVGIGTSSPDYQLDVDGDSRFKDELIVDGQIEYNYGSEGFGKMLVSDANGKLSYTGAPRLSTTGYMYVGNMIIQWGRDVCSEDVTEAFSFPKTFGDCYNVQITRVGVNLEYIFAVKAKSTTGFTINRDNGIDGDQTFYWMAIGRK